MNTKQRIIESFSVKGIPVLTVCPQDADRLPVVFYVHGLSNNKRSGIELGDMLAESGICLISLDAAMHGERLEERLRSAWEKPAVDDIYPFETGLDRLFLMFKIIEQTARDIQTLLEHFRNDRRMDIQRLGVCGSSMGGFVAFLTAANVSSVKTVVSFISHASPLEFWQDALLEASCQPRWQASIKSVEAETQKRLEYLEQIDPLEKIKQTFAPKPLLLIAAGLDTDVSKLYNLQLYKTLQPFYTANPDHLSLRIHQGVTHRVVGEMREEALEWFIRFL